MLSDRALSDRALRLGRNRAADQHGAVSIGTLLRKEREFRALSVGEMSAISRIPREILVALEDDRFEDLPGIVFVRGYIKAYARICPFDPSRILAELDKQHTPPVSEEPFSFKSVRRGTRSNFGIAVALVVVLILFGLALSVIFRPRRPTPATLSHNSAVHEPTVGCIPG